MYLFIKVAYITWDYSMCTHMQEVHAKTHIDSIVQVKNWRGINLKDTSLKDYVSDFKRSHLYSFKISRNYFRMYGQLGINSPNHSQAKESLLDSDGELGQAKTSLLNRTTNGNIPSQLKIYPLGV